MEPGRMKSQNSQIPTTVRSQVVYRQKKNCTTSKTESQNSNNVKICTQVRGHHLLSKTNRMITDIPSTFNHSVINPSRLGFQRGSAWRDPSINMSYRRQSTTVDSKQYSMYIEHLYAISVGDTDINTVVHHRRYSRLPTEKKEKAKAFQFYQIK